MFYTSPTVGYAGLKFYAEPQQYVSAATGDEMAGSIALQCRQRPGSFTMQSETMGFTRRWAGHLDQCCPHVPPGQLEWKSDINAAAIAYGLLVRTWVHGSEAAGRLFRSPVDGRAAWVAAEEQAARAAAVRLSPGPADWILRSFPLAPNTVMCCTHLDPSSVLAQVPEPDLEPVPEAARIRRDEQQRDIELARQLQQREEAGQAQRLAHESAAAAAAAKAREEAERLTNAEAAANVSQARDLSTACGFSCCVLGAVALTGFLGPLSQVMQVAAEEQAQRLAHEAAAAGAAVAAAAAAAAKAREEAGRLTNAEAAAKVSQARDLSAACGFSCCVLGAVALTGLWAH